jgi:exonuclease SbcC
MIKSLALVNVQAHKETFMNFSSGMNVIAGPSDRGKSTIIRAIEWNRTNRPPGETYRNWYTDISDPMATEITLWDGSSVAISREDGKTSYLLITDQEYTFKAIKTDVPEEILEALNLSDYNVQSQHEKYFLLQDTAGEVARQLNELVGLDIIDTAYKNLNARIRKSTEDIETFKRMRDDTEKTLEGYANLAEIEKLITNIERSQEIIQAKTASRNDLQKVKISIVEIKTKRSEITAILSAEDRVSALLERITKLTELTKKRNILASLSVSLKEIKDEKVEDDVWISLEEPCKSLLDRIAHLAELKKKRADLADIKTKLVNIRNQKLATDTNIETQTTKYLEIMTKAGICPTCGTQIDKNKLASIKEYL